jgi:dienelactone hydrolase
VPNSALLPVNITQWFAATVGYDPSNKGVTWAVTQGGTECSSGCGTIAPSATASGISTTYTAPAKVPANSAVTIAATSVTDTTKTANAAITLTVGTVKLVPDSLGFGHVVVKHSSSPQTATLTNTGRAALGITGITITGSTPGDFSQTNTCGTQVGAGMSCTITVTFTPQEWHARGATMYISDTSVDSPQQIILSGVGITGDAADTSAVRSALAGSGMATVPSPTGPSNVGTRVMNLVDGARDDPFLANGAKRELLVRFWYPAPSSQDCEPAEYTSPAVWSYFSQLLGVPLPEVKTNSCLDAPITEGRHPVVVFTHGYTGTFTDYTFIFEDLASRGYVVASVDHTYEATAVEFLDGRFVKSVLGSHWDDTWQPDEQTLSFAVSVRLGDLRFVIGELERLNAAADSPFSGRLDVSRIAIAGHSLGGMTALNGALQDARFRAAVLIDGWPDTLTTATETPVLILAAGHERWSDGERGLWNDLRGPRLAVNLRGAEHLTPSDLVWLAKGATKTGTMGTEKTIAAVRDYVAAFLDANLLGKPMDSLLSGPSSEYPEAEVTTQNESLRGKP